ncbi:hypothetical protein ROT00_00300 [Agromyces mediolanus]|uniref:hypothetical protein n=1 Tax=Agromyces mediolanus TaxID=41986 RepID=UPI00383405AA
MAELTNFPKGRTDGDEKTTCFDPQGGEVYSGEARWEVRSGFLVTLAFEESEVVISSGAQFGEQDWTEIGYVPCDGSVIWKIGLVCGDSGYGQRGPSDSPQAGVFRERCTAEELE